MARTTSLSLPPDAFATAFARDNGIETPAKLRSDDICLLRTVGGDIIPARLSRDFGSVILPTTSETLLSKVGTLPANLIAVSIWNIAWSNRIEPRLRFPE